MSRALHSDYNLPLYLLTRLSFKAVRGSFLFSFVIIFVLIPILNYGNYKLLGLTPELQITVVHTARRLMPIACVFPAVMLFRLFMQTDSKELLRITMCTRRLWVAFLACALRIGLGGAVFVAYSRLFDGMFAEFCKIVAVCIMLFGIVSFLMSFSALTAITLLLLTVYEVFLIVSTEPSFANFVLYYNTKADNAFSWLYITALGIFAMLAGEAVWRIRH